MNLSQKTGLKTEERSVESVVYGFPSKGHDMENVVQIKRALHSLNDEERDAFYQTVFTRRDVRGQFRNELIPQDVLSRIFLAAHYAPSVGFMQPWNFIVIRAKETKQKIHALFEKAHGEAAEMFDKPSRDTYRNLKLEGILESPINICITCDRDRAGPVVIGRTHIKTMDVYSSVCAVQNLWLAARAEGVGLGWVSILDQKKLKETLKMPKNVVPVAYVCLGYVSHFYDKPELQSAGWRQRLPLEDLVNFEEYDKKAVDPFAIGLLEQVAKDQEILEREGYTSEFAGTTTIS